MNLIENKTKFTHKKMSSWGIGIFRKLDRDYIIVEFENAGLKKFHKSAINSILVLIHEVDETAPFLTSEMKITNILHKGQNSSLIQFDGESNGIAGKNVIESFEGNDIILFNETYIIIGDNTQALKIHAMYDLTIIGNVKVQECIVNGSLTIIGDACISNLTCQNTFICRGNLYSNKIYVGRNMHVGSIDCSEIVCDGNVVLQTTININNKAKIGKAVIACEGIMGAGTFSAENAIANEYFEFDGEYEGRISELATGVIVSDTTTIVKEPSYKTTREILDLLRLKLVEEYAKYSKLKEDEIIDHLKIFRDSQYYGLEILSVIEPLFKKVIEISSQDSIKTMEDFLIVLMAQKVLPMELCNHEVVNNIYKRLLPNAQNLVHKLEFEPYTIEQFLQVLSMAIKLKEELAGDWEIVMDKIFESVGLKYSTVNSIISKNHSKENLAIVVELIDDLFPKARFNEKPSTSKSLVSHAKRVDSLVRKLNKTKNKFGFIDLEFEGTSTIKIKTFGNLIRDNEIILTKVSGKKAFLVEQLVQTINKAMAKLLDVE